MMHLLLLLCLCSFAIHADNDHDFAMPSRMKRILFDEVVPPQRFAHDTLYAGNSSSTNYALTCFEKTSSNESDTPSIKERKRECRQKRKQAVQSLPTLFQHPNKLAAACTVVPSCASFPVVLALTYFQKRRMSPAQKEALAQLPFANRHPELVPLMGIIPTLSLGLFAGRAKVNGRTWHK